MANHSTNSFAVLLEELFSKRGPTREEALSNILKAFTSNIQHKFAENLFVTLQHRCENSIKRGSIKEICLASQVTGLLSITLGYGDEANEIYSLSIPTLSQALKSSGSGTQTIKIMECLAIVTFVGAESFVDTESSMKIIWQFIHPELDSNEVTNKHSATVLDAAISAWSFLLSTMDGDRLNHKYWKGVIPYFSKLLETESTCDRAIEALALIFEKGFLDKFTSQATDSIHKEVSNLFEDECRLETSIEICGNIITFLTRSQLKKLNFLKCFLGDDGFEKHMLENEFLQNVFNFKPEGNHHSTSELYTPEINEVAVRMFLPKARSKESFQRMYQVSEFSNKQGKDTIIKEEAHANRGSCNRQCRRALSYITVCSN